MVRRTGKLQRLTVSLSMIFLWLFLEALSVIAICVRSFLHITLQSIKDICKIVIYTKV